VAPLLAALEGTGEARYDVLVLADVVFNHSQHHALLQTCAACLREDGLGVVRPCNDHVGSWPHALTHTVDRRR
jgi:predicted nicotinamide N-methyase